MSVNLTPFKALDYIDTEDALEAYVQERMAEHEAERAEAWNTCAYWRLRAQQARGLLLRVHGSLHLLDLPHREFGGVTDKTASDIAAYLAAN